MEDADRTPFRHLSINDAQKSLIVDKAIEFRRTADNDVDIDVTLEVRFYRRNGEGNADRLATIEFMIEDVTSKQRIRTLTWSTPTNSGTRFQGSNAEDMAENLEQLALDAALIAVQRLDG